MPESGHRLPRLAWWSLVLVVAVLLKAHYRLADAHDLEWMLAPLAAWLELLTPYDFERLASGAYLDTMHDIAIVKACAGINFMVMSLLLFACRFGPAKQGLAGARLLTTCMQHLVLCLLLSWVTAVIVNSARIVLVMQIYIHDLAVPGLSDPALHRLAGVLVFFPALWLQVRAQQPQEAASAFRRTAAVYLGLLVALPVVTGAYRVDPAAFVRHAGFVAVVVGLFGALAAVMRFKDRTSARSSAISDCRYRKSPAA